MLLPSKAEGASIRLNPRKKFFYSLSPNDLILLNFGTGTSICNYRQDIEWDGFL
jgi:hypothetical protein